MDKAGRNVIPDSIKLRAGRTAQEYNQRKNCKGAYWEDRYHAATAIQTGEHPAHCMTYIDGAFELREEQAAYSCYENEDWNLIAWNELLNDSYRDWIATNYF